MVLYIGGVSTFWTSQSEMNIFGSTASILTTWCDSWTKRETKIPYLDLEFKGETAGEPGIEVDLVIEIEGSESHRVVDGVLLQDGRQVLRVHGRMIAPKELVSFYKIKDKNQDESIVETLTQCFGSGLIDSGSSI